MESKPQSVKQHRLVVRAPGNPRLATVELDGQQLTFVSRIEFTLDLNGKSEAKLTVPVEFIDLDVDAAAFVTAHTSEPPQTCAATWTTGTLGAIRCAQPAGHYDDGRGNKHLGYRPGVASRHAACEWTDDDGGTIPHALLADAD